MNSIEKVWKEFLTEAVNNGKWITKDDGDNILEILDNHCFIENIITNVMGEHNNISLEMFVELIGKGVFNIGDYPIKDSALKSYVIQLDDDNQIFLDTESFIYTYPERLFNIKQSTRKNDIVNINQFDVICNRLREHDGSNRAVATLYIGALDQYEQHIPCLNWLQCLIREDKLSLHVMFRSNDLYTAFPSNMLFLQYFGLKITEELKKNYPLLVFKGIYYNSTSLHIYRGDYKQTQRIVKGELNK